MTALDWALSQSHGEVADFLRQADAPAESMQAAEQESAEEAVIAPVALNVEVTELTDGVSLAGASELNKNVDSSGICGAEAEHTQTNPSREAEVLRQALDFDAAVVQCPENVLCGRYYILPAFPLLASGTTVVLAAMDFGLSTDYTAVYQQFCKKKEGTGGGGNSPKAQLLKMSSSNFRSCVEFLQTPCPPYQLPPLRVKQSADELFVKYALESTSGIFLALHEFLQFCQDCLGKCRQVAIKFMRDEAAFHWERSIREQGQLSSNFVAGLITAVPVESMQSAVESLVFTDPFGTVRKMKYYPHALVMPAADRSMDSIIRQERPDVGYTRELMREVAQALQHIHHSGIMHGNLNALNVVRIDSKMVLLDLGSAVQFGDAGSATGARFSSGVLPPEMFATLTKEEEEQYEEYWKDEMRKGSEVWAKICPVKLHNGSAVVVRTVDEDRPDGNGLPYDLVSASDMVDIWAFGLLMYCCVNPTGNSLLSVNQDGDLVRTIENFDAASNWGDDEFTSAVLHNVPDPLAADLLLKILRRNPAHRYDITQILAHPYFTDPCSKKREAKLCQVSILKQRKLMTKIDRQAEAVYHCSEQVLDVADKVFLQIKKTDMVLMRSVFLDSSSSSAELMVPTCFILVNRRIVAEDSENVASDAITSSNWIENLSDLGNSDEELFLYLLDEFTMQPVLSVSSNTAAAGAEYPFPVRNPAEFVPAVLPLLLLSMKATALRHGTASLASSIGHPNSQPMSSQLATAWTGSLDTAASLQEFSGLLDSAEDATTHITGHDNDSPEAVRIRARYVRDTALKTLQSLYAQHSGLYEAQLPAVHGSKASFCGLRRICVPGGFACWTQEANVRDIRSAGLEVSAL